MKKSGKRKAESRKILLRESAFRSPLSAFRNGRTHSLALLMCVTLAVLCVLVTLLYWISSNEGGSSGSSGTKVQELSMFCASGMRKVVESVAEEYQRKYGVRVLLQYGGSNTLLSQIEVSRTGDLYLAADQSYLELGRNKGLVQEILPLAKMTTVVGVQRGNPKQIRQLKDLLRDDVRVVLGNHEQAAVGRTTRDELQKTGDWSALRKRVHQTGVFKPTVGEVANDIKLGSVDAGILWDAVVSQYSDLEMVRIPELADGAVNISIGLLSSSKHPTESLRFARYLSARDRGLRTFTELGYQSVDGDVWEEVPKLVFFAGSVNRRALEPILERFARHEGVEIDTVYNGCGILTAQMRTLIQDGHGASNFPDTYMACDRYYLETVKELFQNTHDVSNVPIRLVVARGNPKQINSLQDLVRPGVRVAIGQPEQCTIGVLSRRLLEAEGIYQQVLEHNVVTQTATSSLLVPSITTGSADVALVYASDTLATGELLDVVPIDSPLALAVQPFGVARSSDHKHLSQRLFSEIAKSREQFEAAGFQWQLNGKD
jgi:molybdate transport system substrate-binding protein